MTVRQTTRSLLRRAQAESARALAGIASKYGLKVKAIPEATSAYETTMKVVVAVPTYKSQARAKAGDKDGDARKIVVISKRNPHRPGTKAAKSFEALKKSATLDEFRIKAARSPGGYYPSWYAAWAARSHGGKPALIKLR